MAAFGIAATADAPMTRDVEVWPENWDTFHLFAACATQWHRAGMAGVPTGLDYQGVAQVAQWLDIDMTADRFGDLRAAEDAALELWMRH